LLFDTGQGLQPVLSGNAKQLGIHLEQTEAIVLSHGHYDHTGGLGEMLRIAPGMRESTRIRQLSSPSTHAAVTRPPAA